MHQLLGEVLQFVIEMHLLDEHYSIQLQQWKPSVMLHCRKANSVCWEPTERQLHCLSLYRIIFNICVVFPSVSEFSFNTSRSAYFSRDFLKSRAVFILCGNEILYAFVLCFLPKLWAAFIEECRLCKIITFFSSRNKICACELITHVYVFSYSCKYVNKMSGTEINFWNHPVL